MVSQITESLLNHPEFRKAVSDIVLRAESRDLGGAVSYIDVGGVLVQVMSNDSQIIYGRRGTGKTHLFRTAIQRSPSNKQVSVYIDVRRLGSSSYFKNPSEPVLNRWESVCRDIWGLVKKELESHFAEYDSKKAEYLSIVEDMNVWEREVATPISQTEMSENEALVTGEASVNLTDIGGKVSGSRNSSGKTETEYTFEVVSSFKFSEELDRVEELLSSSGRHLNIYIDEWSDLPIELQPYVSEYLKRLVVPCRFITLRIAALRESANFCQKNDNGYVGFEVGADIFAKLDLDNYFVFEKDPKTVLNCFKRILYQHVSSNLNASEIYSMRVHNEDAFVREVFNSYACFIELVIASEGIVRDFLNIFNNAFFSAIRSGQARVTRRTVAKSAREWFNHDKLMNLDESLKYLLRAILGYVVVNKKSRYFHLDLSDGFSKDIMRIYHCRVFHLTSNEYYEGIDSFAVFALDYGSYSGYIDTDNYPLVLPRKSREELCIEPYNDGRYFRSVLLSFDDVEYFLR